MRVGLALIGAPGNRHGGDAIRNGDVFHISEIFEEAFEPEFEVEAVAQNQIGVTGAQEVARRRLIIVDLGAGLGDAFDIGRIACDVLRHVGDDGEGGDDLGLFLSRSGEGQGDQAGKEAGAEACNSQKRHS
ncbi:hypothetical protein D3C71_1267280 [compost metagenome]